MRGGSAVSVVADLEADGVGGIPRGLGAARKAVRGCDAQEAQLLEQMRDYGERWRSLSGGRLVDLVLQRQGYPKLLWRLKTAAGRPYVHLFRVHSLPSGMVLPARILSLAAEVEPGRMWLNARMKAVLARKRALLDYISGIKDFRAFESG